MSFEDKLRERVRSCEHHCLPSFYLLTGFVLIMAGVILCAEIQALDSLGIFVSYVVTISFVIVFCRWGYHFIAKGLALTEKRYQKAKQARSKL